MTSSTARCYVTIVLSSPPLPSILTAVVQKPVSTGWTSQASYTQHYLTVQVLSEKLCTDSAICMSHVTNMFVVLFIICEKLYVPFTHKPNHVL